MVPGPDDSTVILTVPALPAFADVAQTAIEELAQRAGLVDAEISRLSQAVAQTMALLLSERRVTESIRLWLEADGQSVAVEAGPMFASADGRLAPLGPVAVRRFQDGLAELVDVVAIDTGTSVVRFVKAAVLASQARDADNA